MGQPCRRSIIACAKPKKKYSSASQPLPEEVEMVDAGEGEMEEDGWLEGDELAGSFPDEADSDFALLGMEEDEPPGISTGNIVWGEAGLKAAQTVGCTEIDENAYPYSCTHAGTAMLHAIDAPYTYAHCLRTQCLQNYNNVIIYEHCCPATIHRC